MAGAFVQNWGYNTGGNSVSSPEIPVTGATPGNVLIANLSARFNETIVVSTSGWTLISGTEISADHSTALYWRVATGNNASDSISWTYSLGDSRRSQGEVVEYSGLDTVSPIDGTPATSFSNANSNSFTLGPVTPTNAGLAHTVLAMRNPADWVDADASWPPTTVSDGFTLNTATVGIDGTTSGAGGVGSARLVYSTTTAKSVTWSTTKGGSDYNGILVLLAEAGGTPPVGIQEMYIKDGGIFVKYTPHVKVGGTFQEVDAYVLDGGTWKPVHEK